FGLAYMLLARWMLPKRSGKDGGDEYLRLDRYRTELLVVKDSRWNTRPLGELPKALGDKVRLVAWLRREKRRSCLGTHNPLLSGDVLVVEASAEALASFHDDPGIVLAPVARSGGKGNDKESQLVQAVIGPGSEFIGRSIRELEYSRQVDAVIAGLWRRDGEITTRLSDARLREGDLLVLWGKPEDFADLAAHHGFLMLVPFAGEAKRRVRAPLALAILGATITA